MAFFSLLSKEFKMMTSSLLWHHKEKHRTKCDTQRESISKEGMNRTRRWEEERWKRKIIRNERTVPRKENEYKNGKMNERKVKRKW